jgi:hypothetical protein
MSERSKDDQIADLNKAIDKLMDIVIKQNDLIDRLVSRQQKDAE